VRLGDGDQPGLPGRGLAVGRGGQRDGGLFAGLSPTLDRWTNVVLAGLEVVSIVASAVGETWASSWLLSSHRECPVAADRLVRLDLAQAGGNTTLKAANLLVGSPLAAEPRPVRLKAEVAANIAGATAGDDGTSDTAGLGICQGPAVAGSQGDLEQLAEHATPAGRREAMLAEP
jgi:hypothetical protein